jgi:cytochrome c oxidase subunit 2
MNSIAHLIEIPDWLKETLPVQASDYASEVDDTFYVEYVICLFFMVLIYGLTIYFCVKYRRRGNNDPVPPRILHNWPLEITWTILPTLICFGMFYVGAKGYLKANMEPNDHRVVNVIGTQWQWNFHVPYKNDSVDIPIILYLELGKPVVLRMRSETNDVLHSLYVPAFRLKADVIPRRYSKITFTPTLLGDFPLYCAEYCGKDHSTMLGRAIVLSKEDYNKKIKEEYDKANALPPGEKLYRSKCMGCHKLDDTKLSAPSFKNLLGRKEMLMTGEITIDEAYIRKSIRNPGADVVKGYAAMPPLPLKVTDAEIDELVKFLMDPEGERKKAKEKAEKEKAEKEAKEKAGK